MLSALIIDDELKGRLALKQKLAGYCPEVQVMDEAADGPEGIEQIKKYHPDLIFLDIEMPGMDGFEMLRQIENKRFQIIFTTAYDQYAIQAIKYSAFDYLLKPVDIDELRNCIGRINIHSHHQTFQKLSVLEENLHHGTGLNKIAIPTLDGLLFYNTNDIIHLEAQSNYTCIYFNQHPKLIASRTLKEFGEILSPEIFFRAHHSHIINLNYIRRYIRGDGGQIEMQNGNFVDLARRKKDEFLRIIA